MRIEKLLCAVMLAAVGACGGGSDGTTPPPPPQTLASITATPNAMNLSAGATQTIDVKGTDTNGGNISSLNTTFTSRSEAIAFVASNGQVVGVGAGNTSIDVSSSFNGVTKTATVAVTVTGQLSATASVTAGVAQNVFTPQAVAVARGGTVTWTFGSVVHNVNFDATPGAPPGISERSNTSVPLTFNTVGNFSYVCTIHAGMAGLVIVR